MSQETLHAFDGLCSTLQAQIDHLKDSLSVNDESSIDEEFQYVNLTLEKQNLARFIRYISCLVSKDDGYKKLIINAIAEKAHREYKDKLKQAEEKEEWSFDNEITRTINEPPQLIKVCNAFNLIRLTNISNAM